MKYWRGLRDRLSDYRLRIPFILGIFLLLVVLSGCQGGLRHESWPGMSLVDGTLYVANLESVQAINAETGKVYWSFPPEDDKNIRPFYSTPVLAEDFGPSGLLLIAGFKDKTVYALQLGDSPAERPDELWRFDKATGQYVGSGTIANGLFIIGNGDGTVYALNIADGTLVWSFRTGDRIWATPITVNGVAYVASLDHFLYALDIATGVELWKIEMEGAIAASPVYANDSIWIGDFSSTLSRINIATQSVEWTYKVESWLWATPLLDGSTLYIVDVGGNLYALNTETNAIVWTRSGAIADIVHGNPVLNDDSSRLYVAGFEKGEIHVFDTENGSLVRTWTQKDAGRLPGDLVTDGVRLYTLPILVPDRVQAFDLFTGDRLWPEVQAQ